MLILLGSAARLISGAHQVQGLPVLIVSGIPALVMLVGALILDGDLDDDDEDRLNMRAVLLDTAGDAAAAAGVAVAGAVILTVGGWFWLDPLAASVISAAIGFHAVRLLRKITGVLRASRQSYRS